MPETNSVAEDKTSLKSKDAVKHILCNVGEDINGNFQQHHVDFYICFGTCHTEKGAIFVSLLIFIIFIIDIITCFIFHLWDLIPFLGILFPIEIALIYGIKRDKELFILMHLILSSLMMVIAAGMLIIVSMAAINKDNLFFLLMADMFQTSDLDTQYVCLLYAIIIGITIALVIWINWTLYIHYCYLKGLHILRNQSHILNA